ncbi:MAG: glucose 1-dehydrogenase [Hydrotalea flava]|uniref:SDR family NAD(P)-dependent oxidoreductase n=1 Tax=Hydrotalea TaxID=1004300 RepID=UPI0016B16130|nr:MULTISPECIES: SDR family oxidoreductase [Hydrotalea]NIM35215.1 glucose 1-dehydrogenase [Hydrotalea flava]NIM38051.1 glucose 1-dehydrogenase [Hydrotalea flava]NIN03221.1 glucose 1-dehydrogenase [Hydrotalea flava]NIN14909.1 glucose 1-dehydrogenase [Hydrotalea flava]NIO93977.1 glucose 1-dehydrogenase [Hydrotalea flava]
MTNNKPLKTAIVTGGGSGIGLAITELFIQNGIRTIIIGRDVKKLQATKEKLGELCIPIAFNLTEFEKISELTDSLIMEYGPIHTLVNNAGINLKKDFILVTHQEFENILSTNVTAVFALSKAVVKHMRSEKNGNIINISSMASQYGIPKVIAYTASKAAIEGMTKAMAVELSPMGIRVNCIAPGFIATEMSAKALNDDKERMQKVLSRTPLGVLGRPEDIAAAALFLSSDAAKFITGTILPVDGGNSIGF